VLQPREKIETGRWAEELKMITSKGNGQSAILS
jgi:hypothetical protein